jgi:hypothetical protein
MPLQSIKVKFRYIPMYIDTEYFDLLTFNCISYHIHPGPDVILLTIFSLKKLDKIGIFAQNIVGLCKAWIITLVF